MDDIEIFHLQISLKNRNIVALNLKCQKSGVAFEKLEQKTLKIKEIHSTH